MPIVRALLVSGTPGRYPSGPSTNPPSACRRDVLVRAEQIGRVPACLELGQALVLLGAVRRANAVGALVAEEVHVDAARHRLELPEQRPDPRHVVGGALGLLPKPHR